LIAILFLLAIAMVVFFATSRHPATATAADGRKITVERVTLGTHHHFTVGKWWARLLKPIRGKSWAAQRGCYEVRFTNDTPALMVWTRWEPVNRSNTVAVQAAIVDEHGTESELGLNHWNAVPGSFGGSSEPAYVAWLFHNFPRRSEPLRLRIYERDKRSLLTQVVELTFSNPVLDRFTEWLGSELPVKVTTNDRGFVLNSAQQTSNALWRLSFSVRTNGAVDPSWLVGGVTASSASGNIFSTRSNLASAALANISFNLRGALWPEEPVWRFAAEFVHTADFQSGELWALTNVTIPIRGMPVQFATNIAADVRQPVEFKIESIPRRPPDRRGGMRRNANIDVRFEAPDRHVLLVEAKDDQGRQIESEVDPGAPRTVYAFGLAIPEDARAVDLTFAVRRFVTVDFYVKGTSLSRTNVTASVDIPPH